MKFRHSVLAIAIAAASTTAFAAGNPYVDSDTVREVQQVLRDRGFQIGVDGIMGPRTQAALRQFQRAENLDPTGRLNTRTLVALGIQQSAAAGASAPTQYSPEIVRSVQRTLNHRGFEAGPVDGVMGAELSAALKDFQRSENLQETGQLNPGTLAALGIPAEPPLAAAPEALTGATVMQLQRRLNSRGFDAGPVDGRMGPSTRAALREFQRAENLEVTGRPDPRTLSALGISGPLAAGR
jgi:peptidoglycan hydrolase-like protein with peptidoglycan-binding domain